MRAGVNVTDLPTPFKLSQRPLLASLYHNLGYDVSPDALAGRLEKWFRYYFRDFVPQLRAVHDWRARTSSASCSGRAPWA
jgi:hypothetical protein